MPAEAEHVRSALADRDVFIYCGHGGGDPWLGTGATPTARRRVLCSRQTAVAARDGDGVERALRSHHCYSLRRLRFARLSPP